MIKLQTYVSILFSVLIIILTITLSTAIGRQATDQMKEEIGLSMHESAYQTMDKLNRFIWARTKEVNVLSTLDQMKVNPEDTQPLLEKLQTEIPAYSWIGVTDVNGIVQASTSSILEDMNISERPVIKEGLKGLYIGDVHEAVLLAQYLEKPDDGSKLKFVDISTPIYHSDGTIAGVFATHLSWEWVKQLVNDMATSLKANHSGVEVLMVSKIDNTVLIGPDNLIGKPMDQTMLRHTSEAEKGWSIDQWADGKEYVTGFAVDQGYQDYPGLGWKLFIRQPVEAAYEKVNSLIHTIILLGTGATILFAVIGWIIAREVTKPLYYISSYAKRLKAGESVQLPFYKGIKEIESLTISLRDLVESLTHTTSRLGTMEVLAQRDQLTGLHNRVAFEQFNTNIKENLNFASEQLVVLYLDLDGFKSVNDTYGHAMGDKLLQQVANRLKHSVRGNEKVYRIGGDEFVVILHGSASPIKTGTIVAKRMIEEINTPFEIDGVSLKVGCSVGGALWPKDDDNFEQVVRYADESLYDVKRAGKNDVLFYRRER